VPQAVLALKQGFGRLIRTKTDRGVLALLDTRLQRMPYGKIFLESLPQYGMTHELAEVTRFFAGNAGLERVRSKSARLA
jgi:ATP-dependent DNA helicase DinG